MSTNNDWILMSERKPTKADLPVWVYYQNGQREVILNMWFPPKYATHWKPAAAFPAPPREKTQGEADDAAFQEWREVAPASPAYMAWHAALAYERAEVGKMLPEPIGKNTESMLGVHSRIEAIRARCGGGK